MEFVIFGIMPKQNLMRTLIFVMSTSNLEHNLVTTLIL